MDNESCVDYIAAINSDIYANKKIYKGKRKRHLSSGFARERTR